MKNPAVDAEFALYRRSEMKNWAKFLADEVRAVWPGMPVHAKIMIMNSTFDKSHAIDPEMFAEFSDYNGNDNYGNYKEGGYFSDWVQFALSHELPVFDEARLHCERRKPHHPRFRTAADTE